MRAITHGSLVTALTPRYLTYSRQVSKFFLDGAFERLRFASKILPQTLTSTFFQKLVYCVSPRRNKLLNAGEIKFLLKSADLILRSVLTLCVDKSPNAALFRRLFEKVGLIIKNMLLR